MKKKKKMKHKKSRPVRKRITLRELLTAQLPAAIMSRITPLLTVGGATFLMALIVLIFPPLRLSSPMFALLGLTIILYALWTKLDVLRNGYDEHIFKVVDYSQFWPIATKNAAPTGLFLMKKTEEDAEEEDNSVYHISISAKGNLLPPIDWLIRVYVPKGMEAVPYGDRKYFPTVYGYRIEGEDKQQ